MTDEEARPKPVDEGTYEIEDTGETLDDFVYEAPAPEESASESGETGDPSLQEENLKLRDQLLRNLADFENFRKRAEREKNEYRRYALIEFIRNVLPVLDNFERALASDSQSSEDFRKGVELIQKQLLDALVREGLAEVNDTGVPFDPNFHEAVMQEEDASFPNHSVKEILQKGYFLRERLVRPALVKVAVGGLDSAPTVDGDGASEPSDLESDGS